MRLDNFQERRSGTFNFQGNQFPYIFTNATLKLGEINCFKYESSYKDRKTVMLVIKSVLPFPSLI